MLALLAMLGHMHAGGIFDLYCRVQRLLSSIMPLSDHAALPGKETGREYSLDSIERASLLDFIEMANNAYHEHNLDNVVSRFGYGQDGLRAKVFEYNGSIVVAFKGTSLSLLGIEAGRTSRKDKAIDQILYTRCDAADGGCREKKLGDFHRLGYLDDAMEILNATQSVYRGRNVVLIGHSLGGTIASLVGIRRELPVVAFGSPGDAHFADILGIYDASREYRNILQIGMCCDTVFNGECSLPYSPCRVFGYSVETKCHVGRSLCVRGGGFSSLMYHTMGMMAAKIRLLDEVTLFEDLSRSRCIH